MATGRPLSAGTVRPYAEALAAVLDGVVAEDWSDGPPTMAVLSWHGPGDDDLELVTKQLDGTAADELDALGPDLPCLAVALSRLEQPDVRVTVAIDEFDDVSLVRHLSGRLERPDVAEGSTADLLRQSVTRVKFQW